MKGLELSKLYFAQCRPHLMKSVPFIMEKAAIGLAGEGSECFGLDDQISRDHDFGPAFCIWLPDDILAENREILERALLSLPGEFMGFKSRLGQKAMNRVGPIGIRSFYKFFTGLERIPENWGEWLGIAEENLATVVNGEVFEDNLGQFSAWRKTLADFYPEDVRLKKLAARAMIMGQAGQYNLPRSLNRDDRAASLLSFARFAEAALSFVFLLNKQYKPYYKLAARKARELPVLGEDVFTLLNDYGWDAWREDLMSAIESFCDKCAATLREMGLSDVPDSWLWLHGPSIARHISADELRRRDLLHD